MSKVHFITQGCSANQADSEIMQGHLLEKGHSLSSEASADVVVFNSCSVKGPTVSYFKKKMKDLENKGKKVVISGCIPQSGNLNGESKLYSQIGTYQLDKVSYVVESTLKGQVVVELKRENKVRLSPLKVRSNKLIETVPVLQGCLSACTFCKTKQARGHAFSYPSSDIVRQVSYAVKDGAKEIWLTSQDNAVYGHEFGGNLAQLLEKIVTIPRDFTVRVGMANPQYILPMMGELISAFQHPKIYKFLHIPVQSGSDSVLKDMKRGYSVSEYLKIITAFKKAIPSITISTDIICGFPTESDADFEKTIQIVKKTQPDIINISRFWPMEGTSAARMEQLDGAVIKEWTRKLTSLYKEVALEQNQKWIGKTCSVLINEEGKNRTFKGRNEAYKQVVVSGKGLMGKKLKVKITDCSSYDLKGTVV